MQAFSASVMTAGDQSTLYGASRFTISFFRSRAIIKVMLATLLYGSRHSDLSSNLAVRVKNQLCVPNIRFSMDAENRRGKFAT